MAPLVIVGANGMLGSDLMAVAQARDLAPVGFDLPDIDITDPASVKARIPAQAQVVNCAAYTRVDDAEAERDLAFRINGDGAGVLARGCAECGAHLLQLSTDYVFDGTSARPYAEADPVCPINVYGESKLAGECQVQAAGGRHLIVRVQSLFGRHGHNFIKAISNKLQDEDPQLRVVDDQHSSPTYTRHLAEALLDLLAGGQEGVVNVRAAGHCTWFEFAQAIADRVRPGVTIAPVPSTAYPRPAARPPHSILNTSRFTAWTGRSLPSWEEGLDAYLAEETAA